jgi:hypothetical protein
LRSINSSFVFFSFTFACHDLCSDCVRMNEWMIQKDIINFIFEILFRLCWRNISGRYRRVIEYLENVESNWKVVVWYPRECIMLLFSLPNENKTIRWNSSYSWPNEFFKKKSSSTISSTIFLRKSKWIKKLVCMQFDNICKELLIYAIKFKIN